MVLIQGLLHPNLVMFHQPMEYGNLNRRSNSPVKKNKNLNNISNFSLWLLGRRQKNPIFQVLRKVQKIIHLPLCNRISVNNNNLLLKIWHTSGNLQQKYWFRCFQIPLYQCWLKTDLNTHVRGCGSSIATFTCGRSLLMLQVVDGWTRSHFYMVSPCFEILRTALLFQTGCPESEGSLSVCSQNEPKVSLFLFRL